MKLYGYFFLSGIIFGFSFCLLNCGLLLFPVVGEGSFNYKQGLLKGIIFNFGKIFSYVFYGGIASYSHFLLKTFIESKYSFIVGGIFLIIYGIWFFLKTGGKHLVIEKFQKINLHIFLLGLIYGLVPCGPLIGFFLYVFYVSKGILFGMISGFLFGLGATFGPLFLCLFIPYIWKFLYRSSFKIFLRLISSFIFIFWGVNLILLSLSP